MNSTDQQKQISPAERARALRQKFDLTLFEFWNRVGGTRQDGERYERESLAIPLFVQKLLSVAYEDDEKARQVVKEMRGVLPSSDIEPRTPFYMDTMTWRRKLNLNQKTFWGKIGVTQSGGVRYESGDRPLPQTVRKLLVLAYGDDAEAKSVIRGLRRSDL